MAMNFNVSGNDPGTQQDGTTGGAGTLSNAIAQINAMPASGGPYTITLTGDVTLKGPLPPILGSVTINGAGYKIDAGGTTRIFFVGTDQASLAANPNAIIGQRQEVAINNVTLANGNATGGAGGGSTPTLFGTTSGGAGGGGLGAGGAIFVNQTADVTLTGVTFSGDKAVGGAGGPGGSQGGGGGLGGAGGYSPLASFSDSSADGRLNSAGGGGGLFGIGGSIYSKGQSPAGTGGGGLFGNGPGNAGGGSGGSGGGGGFSGNGGNAGSDGRYNSGESEAVTPGQAGTLRVSGLTGSGGASSQPGGANGGGGGGAYGGDGAVSGGGGGFNGHDYSGSGSPGTNGAGGFGGGGGGNTRTYQGTTPSRSAEGGPGGFGGGGGSGAINGGAGGFGGGGGSGDRGGGAGGFGGGGGSGVGGTGGNGFVYGGGPGGFGGGGGGSIAGVSGASGGFGAGTGGLGTAGNLGAGGGGAALGGSIFVASGGTLSIDGGGVSGSVTRGAGAAGPTASKIASTNGDALGDGIFYQGTDGHISTLTFGDGDTGVTSTIADYSGSGGTNPNGGTDAADQGGSVMIEKTDTGTLTLASANTYTGGTTIYGGTVSVAHTQSFGLTQTYVVDALGSGTIVLDGSTASLRDGGGLEYINNTILVGPSGGSIDTGGDNPLLLQGSIVGGTGDLTYTGGGAIIVSQDTHGGATITGGTVSLEASGANAFSSTSAFQVGSGTSVDLGGTNQTIASLAGSGTVQSNGSAATLTIGGSATARFSGVLRNGTASGTPDTLKLVKQGNDTQILAGTDAYSGGTTIAGGILEGDSAAAFGSGAITFAGADASPATLALHAQPANGGTFSNVLNQFGPDSELDLAGLDPTTTTTVYNAAAHTLTVNSVEGLVAYSATYKLTNETLGPANQFYVHRDASGTGALIDTNPVCFATGTLIRTADGDRAVEALRVSDLAVTASGVARPIRWLGHRTIDCRAYPQPRDVWPIRVAAHAFGDGLPATDLFLSAGHSVRVGVVGEVLIPIGKLINGATIARHPVDEVTYWHVELDSHDVLIANNLLAESFLDCGNRFGLIEREGDYDRLAGPHTPADFCLPYIDAGPIVAAVRERLSLRAAGMGWTTTRKVDLHLMVDGVRIDPDVAGPIARFIFPASARHVTLASAAQVPSDQADVLDHRRLGVSIHGLEIEDGLSDRAKIPLDDARLAAGFHPEEAAAGHAHRFTDGHLQLPAALWAGCRGQVLLRVHHEPQGAVRWIAPAGGGANVVALSDFG